MVESSDTDVAGVQRETASEPVDGPSVGTPATTTTTQAAATSEVVADGPTTMVGMRIPINVLQSFDRACEAARTNRTQAVIAFMRHASAAPSPFDRVVVYAGDDGLGYYTAVYRNGEKGARSEGYSTMAGAHAAAVRDFPGVRVEVEGG